MSGRTVKVRVAVAVDSEGEWCAAGWTDGEGKLSEGCDDHILDGLGPICNQHWIWADLPIPEPAEVEATVEAGR